MRGLRLDVSLTGRPGGGGGGGGPPTVSANVTPGYPVVTAVTVPTVESTNAPVEPSINYVPGFNGFDYWLGFNNYATANNDQVENPSVVCSNDGNTFTTPAGGTNPVFPAVVGGSNGVWHNGDDRLYILNGTAYLFNLLVDLRGPGAGGSAYAFEYFYKTSTDMVNWSAAQTTGLRFAYVDANTKAQLQDAAFLFDSVNNQWNAWTIRADAAPGELDFWTTGSTLGGTWTETVCTMPPPLGAGEKWWHIDIKPTSGGYIGLFSTSFGVNANCGAVYLGVSTDKTTWTIDVARPIIDPASGFYAYRTSLMRLPDNTGWDVYTTRWFDRKLKRFQMTDGETFTPGGTAAEAVIAAVEARVGSAIDNTAVSGKTYGYRDVLKALIQRHIDNGDWATFDTYNFRALPAQAHALCDFKGGFDDAIVGTLTFTSGKGFTGGGASNKLVSTWNPTNNAVNYTQNGGAMYFMDRGGLAINISDAAMIIGVNATGSAVNSRLGMDSGSNPAGNINVAVTSGKSAGAGAAYSPASVAMRRSGTTSEFIYWGGVLAGTFSVASTGIPNDVKGSHTSSRNLFVEIIGGGWSDASIARINKDVATAKRQLGI